MQDASHYWCHISDLKSQKNKNEQYMDLTEKVEGLKIENKTRK